MSLLCTICVQAKQVVFQVVVFFFSDAKIKHKHDLRSIDGYDRTLLRPQ